MPSSGDEPGVPPPDDSKEPDVDGAEDSSPQGAGYRIALENYCGPLDLLLYLIREDELNILDVSLASMADQYVTYVNALRSLDINVAGEFVVMATTLMEIKSRTLAPRIVEDEEEPEEPDPTANLVRRLLEYRKFKRAGMFLARRGDEQSLRWLRDPWRAPPPEPVEETIEVDLFQLISAYARLAREVELTTVRSILYDDIPIEILMGELLRRLQAERRSRFSELVGPGGSPENTVGSFLAVLELTRLRRLTVEQEEDFADFLLTYREEPDPPAAVPPPATDAPVDH